MYNKIFIKPRKNTDYGGYACMPLKSNIPEGKENWKLTVCPSCGSECWETEHLKAAVDSGAIPLCTNCALKRL